MMKTDDKGGASVLPIYCELLTSARADGYSGLLASVHRFVASSTANTAARSALSLISAVPLRSSVLRPPPPPPPP